MRLQSRVTAGDERDCVGNDDDNRAVGTCNLHVQERPRPDFAPCAHVACGMGRTSSNAAFEMNSSLTFVWAMTFAARGSLVSSARSPKYCPAPSSITL